MLSTFKVLILDDHALCCEHTRSLLMEAGIVDTHETTANATANAVKLLLQHPIAWRELCEDPGLIPNAVEECLRHNGSVAAWRRLVTAVMSFLGK